MASFVRRKSATPKKTKKPRPSNHFIFKEICFLYLFGRIGVFSLKRNLWRASESTREKRIISLLYCDGARTDRRMFYVFQIYISVCALFVCQYVHFSFRRIVFRNAFHSEAGKKLFRFVFMFVCCKSRQQQQQLIRSMPSVSISPSTPCTGLNIEHKLYDYQECPFEGVFFFFFSPCFMLQFNIELLITLFIFTAMHDCGAHIFTSKWRWNAP